MCSIVFSTFENLSDKKRNRNKTGAFTALVRFITLPPHISRIFDFHERISFLKFPPKNFPVLQKATVKPELSEGIWFVLLKIQNILCHT